MAHTDRARKDIDREIEKREFRLLELGELRLDASRRRELLGASSIGRAILDREDAATRAERDHPPLSAESRRLLEMTGLGQSVLKGRRERR